MANSCTLLAMFTKVNSDLGNRIKAATELLVSKNMMMNGPAGVGKSFAAMKLNGATNGTNGTNGVNGTNGHRAGPNEGMLALKKSVAA